MLLYEVGFINETYWDPGKLNASIMFKCIYDVIARICSYFLLVNMFFLPAPLPCKRSFKILHVKFILFCLSSGFGYLLTPSYVDQVDFIVYTTASLKLSRSSPLSKSIFLSVCTSFLWFAFWCKYCLLYLWVFFLLLFLTV